MVSYFISADYSGFERCFGWHEGWRYAFHLSSSKLIVKFWLTINSGKKMVRNNYWWKLIYDFFFRFLRCTLNLKTLLRMFCFRFLKHKTNKKEMDNFRNWFYGEIATRIHLWRLFISQVKEERWYLQTWDMSVKTWNQSLMRSGIMSFENDSTI